MIVCVKSHTIRMMLPSYYNTDSVSENLPISPSPVSGVQPIHLSILSWSICWQPRSRNWFCLRNYNLAFCFCFIYSPRGGYKLATLMHDNVTRLAQLPLISVCLVRGRAIGGGAELTLSTDFRIFSPAGKLNFVQARLGVLPGWAGGSRLVNLSNCLSTQLQLLQISGFIALQVCIQMVAMSTDCVFFKWNQSKF